MITRLLMMKKCEILYVIFAGRMILGRKNLNPMKSHVFFTWVGASLDFLIFLLSSVPRWTELVLFSYHIIKIEIKYCMLSSQFASKYHIISKFYSFGKGKN